MKECPHCGEEIQDEAIKCRYCREWLTQEFAAIPSVALDPPLRRFDESRPHRPLGVDSQLLAPEAISTPRIAEEFEDSTPMELVRRWKTKKWWLTILGFWFFCATGASILGIVGHPVGAQTLFINLSMIGFVIWCIRNDSTRTTKYRILYVLTCWVIYPFLFFVTGIILIKAHFPISPHLFDRVCSLIATLPIVIYSMRQSELFYEYKLIPDKTP